MICHHRHQKLFISELLRVRFPAFYIQEKAVIEWFWLHRMNWNQYEPMNIKKMIRMMHPLLQPTATERGQRWITTNIFNVLNSQPAKVLSREHRAEQWQYLLFSAQFLSLRPFIWEATSVLVGTGLNRPNYKVMLNYVLMMVSDCGLWKKLLNCIVNLLFNAKHHIWIK